MINTWAARRVVACLTLLGGLSLVFSNPPGWVGIGVVLGMASAFFRLGAASQERAAVK